MIPAIAYLIAAISAATVPASTSEEPSRAAVTAPAKSPSGAFEHQIMLRTKLIERSLRLAGTREMSRGPRGPRSPHAFIQLSAFTSWGTLYTEHTVAPYQWCAAAFYPADNSYHWVWFFNLTEVWGHDDETLLEFWSGGAYSMHGVHVEVYNSAWMYLGYEFKTVFVDPEHEGVCLSKG